MKESNILLCVAGVALGCAMSLAVAGQNDFSRRAPQQNPQLSLRSPEDSAGGRGRECPGSFTPRWAEDRSLSVCIPSDWGAGGVFEHYWAFGNLGESFASGLVEVLPDPGSAMQVAQALQGILPPEQLAIMVRLASPPRLPADVIGRLFPQLAPDAIRSMRISRVVPLPWSNSAAAALVHYRYLLLPQVDLLLRSMLNPALLRQNQTVVPMEGAALVMTFPPLLSPQMLAMAPDLASVNSWTFFYVKIEAPEPAFAREVAVYRRIVDSYHIDFNRLQQKFGQQQQIFAQMREVTQESGDGWRKALGVDIEIGGRFGGPGPEREAYPVQCQPPQQRWQCSNEPSLYCSIQPRPGDWGCVVR